MFYVAMIIFFAFFYGPHVQSRRRRRNLRRQGGYVPGIRPGKQTPTTSTGSEPAHDGWIDLPGDCVRRADRPRVAVRRAVLLRRHRSVIVTASLDTVAQIEASAHAAPTG